MIVPKKTAENLLRRAILSGEYSPGDKVPSIRKMSKQFGVSPATMCKAVASLVSLGMLESHHGKGLFVMKSASAGRSRKILFLHIYPETSLSFESYFCKCFESFSSRCSMAGYQVELCSICYRNDIEIIELIRKTDPSGIALFEIDADALVLDIKSLCIPMVSLDADLSRSGISSVFFDNIWAGFSASSALLQKGHRRISVIAPKISRKIGGNRFVDIAEEQRIYGYTLALRQAGIEEDIVETKLNKELFAETLLEIFRRDPPPSAFFAYNHWQVLLECLNSMGLSIPDDVSFVAINDEAPIMPNGASASSIILDFAEMGSSGAVFLLSSISGVARTPMKKMLSVRFSEGYSVASLLTFDKLCKETGS